MNTLFSSSLKKESFRISASKFHIVIYMAEKTIISIWNSIPFKLVKKKLLVLVHQGHGHLWVWGWGDGRRQEEQQPHCSRRGVKRKTQEGEGKSRDGTRGGEEWSVA